MDSVIAFVIGVVIIAVGLALSIALHEIGHLVPAKLFRVKVTQYMIGFGPTLWSRRRGETEYGVKALPLGGYISMIGMFPPAKGERATADSTGFFRQMVADARESSAETITPGDEGRAFYLLPVWKRIVIMFGGPLMNLVLAFVLYGVLLMGIGLLTPTTTLASVSECVLPDSSQRQTCEPDDTPAPGAAAGFQPGDRIVSVDGQPVAGWADTSATIRDNPGTPIDFVVERDGREVTIDVTPSLNERYRYDDRGRPVTDAAGDPVVEEVGFIGIAPVQEYRSQPPALVVQAVGDNVAGVAGIIVNFPQRIIDVANAAFGPDERDPNGPISVVGVGRLGGEVATIEGLELAQRASFFVQILAALNVALFVFNLIPLLPLDGGHIAGALWEAIRRGFAKLFRRPDPGPVDLAKLMPLTFGVVILLVSMSALLIYADIVKPVSLL